jgi:hypothetical protein
MIGRDPGGTWIPLFCVTWDPPTYTGYRPVLEIRTVAGTFGVGVNAHVGVTAGFTEFGVPGGNEGIPSSSP